jgi:hypothetical protein
MATEVLIPDAITTQVSLSGALTDIDEGTTSPDANWLTNTETNGNTNDLIVTFPTPSGTLNSGVDLQTIRVYIRKTGSNNNNPEYTLAVLENGTPITSTSLTVQSTTGETDSLSWNAGGLTNADGSGVQVRILQTGGGTGRGANRSWIEIGAIDWVADYEVAVGGAAVSQAIFI